MEKQTDIWGFMGALAQACGHKYPDAPGYSNQTTSKDAAEQEKPRAETIRAAILASMKRGYSWTPDRFAYAHDLNLLAVRPRFSELAAKGLIEDSGQREFNDSGRKAIVWRLRAGADTDKQ